MNLIFSIMGLLGGILCAIGDLLLDLKGRGNQKLGTSKNIDSNWMKMSEWRFGVSLILGMIGDAGVGLGIYSLGKQIAENNQLLGNITIYCGYIGAICGGFIHSLLCIQPLIYKGVMKRGTLEIADDALETLYKQVMPTFLVSYLFLMIPTIITLIAIFSGALAVPMWCALLNPIIFLIIGIGFRKIDSVRFQDLPGICMPSIGLSMLCFIGIINMK